MLKILQARLQQYMNWELPDVQAGFRKGRGTRDKIANIRWITEKAREFQKNIHFCFTVYTKACDCVDQTICGKFFKRWNTGPADLPPEKPVCRSRSNRTGHGTMDWFKIGKGVRQAYISSLCLFNLYQSTLCVFYAGLDEAQAGIKIARIRRWHHPNGRKPRGTKQPLDEHEREWKSWLKTQHSKTKIMASGPITSWQIDGETMETVTDFIFLGSKITVDGDCSHEIKRRLLLGRKAMTNLDSILKSRHHFADKGP